LYGSLAKTGLGHGSDIAIMLGLSNEDFTTIDTDKINDKIERIRQRGLINISEDQAISFNYEKHIIFEFNKKLDYHPNGMRFEAILSDGNTISREYFSVGGGFVVTQDSNFVGQNPIITQFPCHTAQDIMKNCKKTKS
jgi:L-serine dehydratase